MEFRGKGGEQWWHEGTAFRYYFLLDGDGVANGSKRAIVSYGTYLTIESMVGGAWIEMIRLGTLSAFCAYLHANNYFVLGVNGYTDGDVKIEKSTTGIKISERKTGTFGKIFSVDNVGGLDAIAAGAYAATVSKVASANVRNADPTEATSTSATYAIARTKAITNGLLGQARYLFDLKTSDTAEAVYGMIYKDGAAWGSEFTVSGPGSDAYATQSEDLTADLAAGTVLTLRVHSAGTATVSVKNFDIAYDDAPVVAVAAVNS
jgi:hypothetical protein